MLSNDSTFVEHAKNLREEEELRNEAYSIVKGEVELETKRDAAVEQIKKKSRNLQRPKHAVLRTWGDWFDEKVVLYMPDQIYDSVDVTAMPRWANIVLISCFVFFTVCIFTYFSFAGIEGAMSIKFISLSGNSTFQICQAIPTTVTGKFSADKSGRWSTLTNYSDNSAIYSVEFSATNATKEEYTAVMEGFASKFNSLGTRMSDADLAWIVMAWTTVSYKDQGTGIRLSTLASIETVFSNTVPLYTNAYSYSGECVPQDSIGAALLYPTAQFSPDFTQIKITYDMGSYYDLVGNAFINSNAFGVNSDGDREFVDNFTPCPAQFSPQNTFAYDPYKYEASSYQDTTVEITFDLRSMLLAASINFGIVSLDDMMIVREETKLRWVDLFQNTTMPPFSFYTDPSADLEKRLMEPIACVPSGSSFPPGNTTAFPFCLVFSRNNFYYPAVFSKRSYEITSSTYCDCDGYPDYTASSKEFCNQMFIELLMVYDKKDVNAKIDNYFEDTSVNVTWHVWEMGAKFANYMALNSLTGHLAISKELRGILTDTGTLQSFMEICPKNRTECGALLIFLEPIIDVAPLTPLAMELSDLSHTYYRDSTGYDRKKQVTCLNTIYDSLAFNNMSAIPPKPLLEPFYECSYTWNQAFITSIGNASASASLYTFFIMYVAITIVAVLAQNYTKVAIANPRVKDYHDGKGGDRDKEIVHAALKRIIVLGKADVLDPAFVELFKEDYDGDVELTRMSLYLKGHPPNEPSASPGVLEDDHLIDQEKSKA